MTEPLTVVISQGQSRNPERRDLEKSLAERSAQIDGVQVLVIPHLYDLAPDGESLMTLRAASGDMVVVSWVYERAAHWILDRGGVRGQVGEVELVRGDEDNLESDDAEADDGEPKQRVIDAIGLPKRTIFCLDFRVTESVDRFVQEIQRIANLDRSPADAADQRYLTPSKPTSLTLAGLLQADGAASDGPATKGPTSNGSPSGNGKHEKVEGSPTLFGIGAVARVDESPSRRWYPVIDFSRCTNCMECIDFCLFGVYGVDTIDTILVEQPDNCRKGCPACSRVCPENAIIFPQHKAPGIAGAPVEVGGLKIDLSKLFGAPEGEEDAIATAARERDEQLLLAGRAAVGMEVGIPKRQTGRTEHPKDDLDSLLDELEGMDL